MSTEYTPVDREFSTLEKLAFQGRWCSEEQNRVMKHYDMYGLPNKGLHTSPEHDRLQGIIAVFSSIEASKTIPEMVEVAAEIKEKYLSRYPNAANNAPQSKAAPEKKVPYIETNI